jgi:hypothetical protein
MIKTVYRLFLSDSNKTRILGQFFEKSSINKFKKNGPIGAELFHADGRIDMTKLLVAFPNFLERDPRITQ